ncbi:hypothetical protein Q5P01_000922 [Channa striata]|uniref:Uncharacterized protein n=1 Tax=Channa striata TaxID=64152 RepID=A0AA88IYJ5_CHASR|nr:hypothetical protein Q5P01_000922 [Channa striata]
MIRRAERDPAGAGKETEAFAADGRQHKRLTSTPTPQTARRHRFIWPRRFEGSGEGHDGHDSFEWRHRRQRAAKFDPTPPLLDPNLPRSSPVGSRKTDRRSRGRSDKGPGALPGGTRLDRRLQLAIRCEENSAACTCEWTRQMSLTRALLSTPLPLDHAHALHPGPRPRNFEQDCRAPGGPRRAQAQTDPSASRPRG